MSTVKKRLHISGLTPSITVSDINARLHGFGKVLALDGFGNLNAVGEPRKFAYVTLEATEANLTRCLNLLSGTTWKGAKLRIGEAKPDYKQRLENERKRAADGVEENSSKRKRLPRGVHGVHARDMSVVSLKNVNLHPGWHETSLSHLIRPMRMRPLHPLPELSSEQRLSSTGKKRKKASSLEVPTRARVQVIDPRLHQTVHLRENMLEAIVDSHPSQTHGSSPSSPRSELRRSPRRDVGYVPKSQSVDTDASMAPVNFEEEKARDLDLLTTMFDDDKSQWGSQESIENESFDGPDGASSVARETKPMTPIEPMHTATSPVKPKMKPLKDLFQPRAEEEAQFSLIAGLGDLDLDLDPAFDLHTITVAPTPAPVASAVPPSDPFPAGGLTLDPSLPLFFPRADEPRAKDLFSVARTEGWEFSRTGDSDTIRKRWDETKGSLTREWKKRAREAVKLRKRRYGAQNGEDT